jgi:2-polyprenyl-3-methyl-5-hydroxy-6-metoxy-1,4-benzoquinol methylase
MSDAGLPPRDNTIDRGRAIDWGKTSADYVQHRPGPPDSFYRMLHALGIGVAGQQMLDLGTGTGTLARRFASQGCTVTGIDIAGEQIEAARQLARQEQLAVDFRVAAAEETGLADRSFDVITACQSWLYFKRPAIFAEVKRLLAPQGRLLTAHLCWLPQLDPIAQASEQLVLRHNPAWTGAGFSGEILPCPSWSKGVFRVTGMFFYDELIPFTRASWQGRIRACRGIGATLKPNEVERFDAEHASLLERIAPEQFSVLHRIDCHVFEPADL